MGDARKTKAELIEELRALRARVAERESRASATCREFVDAAAPSSLADRAARVAATRLQSYLDIAEVAYLALDPDRRITLVNRKTCEILGFPEHEILGKDWYETFVVSKERDRLVERYARIMAGELPPSGSYEMVVRVRDGGERILACHNTLLRDDAGCIVGTLSAGEDVTDRRQAEELLRGREEAERAFRCRLTTLIDVSNALSRLDSSEALLRSAVVWGRSRLGFDRVAIWLCDEDSDCMSGTFGTDEQGNLRDERGVTWPLNDVAQRVRAMHETGGVLLDADGPLHDHAGHEVGRGTHAWSAIWDGERIAGFLVADNLLRQEPFSQYDSELLRLYASVVGSLSMRKRAEEAVRTSEARLRAVFETAEDAIFIKDAAMRYTQVNPAMERLLGLCAADVIGRTYDELFGVHAGARIRVVDAKVLSGEAIETEEAEPLQGGLYTYHAIKVPMYDASGAIIGLCGIARDVTERRETEAALRQARDELEVQVERRTAALRASEERYRRVVSSLPMVLYAEDAGSRAFLLVDGATEEILGYPPDAFYADPALSVRSVHPEDRERVAEAVARGWQDGRPFELEHRVLHGRDGHVVWLHTYVTPVVNEAGEATQQYGVSIDITDRKQAEQALRAAEEKLRMSERLASLGTLAAGVAHEINNPIGSILLAAQFARDSCGVPDAHETVRGCIEDILRDARRCAQIVQDVLHFSGKEPLRLTPCDLNQVVRDAARGVTRYADEHTIVLELSLADSLPPATISAGAIEQVLGNLLRNAVDASRPGGRVCVRTGQTAEGVRIVVQDHGCGIAKHEQTRIFDPFYTTRQREGGVGLGLSISHGIVARHGGRLQVDSEPGHGTIICLDLPVEST
ncbi:MAG: PAS domain S-box protein [Phycisphaerae bacterium]|nr:PAS domain S-box protein [Phycisphaerae bacterium]